MSRAVYIVGKMAVKDYDTYFKQYGFPFLKVLEKYQGEMLASSKKGETLEGEFIGNWTVLAKFPSKELALAFWNSAEYAPLKALRVNELTTAQQAFLFPALKDSKNHSSD